MFDPKQLARFWSKVDQRGENECWPWTGFRNWSDYGAIKWPTGARKDPIIGAHRASYMIAHGPIPDGLCVLHSCDNRPCVNPKHLHVGTYYDNMREMVERGRSGPANHPERMKHGANHHWSRLTPDSVRTVFVLAEQGLTQRAIAERLGSSQGAIAGILQGRSWKYLWREWHAARG